ncbi:MAG: GTPase Era [Synergistaceae bacterium]|jgi:GTP-binding protein Era|nr:GTPase Era [Synergistaceae bacterium]PKL04860.1 MAG: GTPase Era [Synergistetes bacterium HGW-Synergistetes-1]MBP9974859.1 GTPase Era [Synergistaceae bacterium]MCE5183089.1 GTPase Era [Synergistaceae bacterium]MDD4750349.1 GTPase Era [Synergistaceae bacterium]
MINNNIKNEDQEYRCGFVALLGRPNVGKSSIINTLLKEKVAAVSSKPQTTRNAIRCILTTGKEQIIFVDTPGIHKPKHVLGDFMVKEASKTLSQVDLICFVVEAGDRMIGEKEELILEFLSNCSVPIVLAVNKIDKFSDQEVFWKTVEMYETRITPAAVIPLSAKKGTNMDVFIETLSGMLPMQPPIYPADMLMDATERFLAAEVIREKILNFTDQEVPHGTAVVVEEFKSPEEYPELKTCEIRATIIVDREGQKAIIIGRSGAKLKTIGMAARKELEEKFGYPIYLQLWVKVKPGWRKSQEELRRLGYSF